MKKYAVALLLSVCGAMQGEYFTCDMMKDTRNFRRILVKKGLSNAKRIKLLDGTGKEVLLFDVELKTQKVYQYSALSFNKDSKEIEMLLPENGDFNIQEMLEDEKSEATFVSGRTVAVPKKNSFFQKKNVFQIDLGK